MLKTGLLLIKNVLKPLAKIPLGLTAAASATDAAIPKKMFGSGTPALVFANEDLNDIMKIVKFLEESGLSINSVRETIQNEAKEQKGRFLSTLLGTLGASLLRNLLTGEEVKRSKIPGRGVIRTGEGTIRAGQNF